MVTYIHPPTVSCIALLILPNCQEGYIFFAFIRYLQHTECCQQAVCSVSPSSLSLSMCPSSFFLFLSVSLPLHWKDSSQMWQEKRQMAMMTGETFFLGRNENQKIWNEWIHQKHTCKRICFSVQPVYLLASTSYINIRHVCTYTQTLSLSLSHTHTVHMPLTISLFNALALRLMGKLESMTAYNIAMMEMSLSACVLWLSYVLVAEIEFWSLISNVRYCLYSVHIYTCMLYT